MERTTDSIERLASLMDRMDTKLDRRADQYRPRVYQGRNRGCMVIGKTTMVPETDHIVEISIKIAIEEGETTVTEVAIEIIGPIIEITVGPEKGTATEMAIGITIDQTKEEMIVIKGMVIEVKITVDLGTEIGGIGVVPGKVPNPAADPKTDMKGRRQSRDDTRNRDRS